MVKTVIATERNGGKLVRPWIGASGQPVTQDLAEGLGLARPVGVVVNDVYPGGPAAKAGLDVGDVVVAINGRDIDEPEALRFRLATLGVGGTADPTVFPASRVDHPGTALVAP